MDIDALSAVRKDRWSRLAVLSKRRDLSGAEADEMTRLFQQTAGDLATVQSSAPEPGLVARLSMLLAEARIWMTGAHTPSTAEWTAVITRQLPAALYRIRWWATAVSLAVIVLSLIAAVHTLNSPDALALAGTPEQRAGYAEQEFASYYTEYDNGSFAARVYTNNWLVAAGCIAFGIVAAYFPLYLMYNTILQLGVTGAIMAEHGMLDIFFQLIAPHGLLELSAVFVSAAVGIRLFWVMLVPGARTRGRALAEEGRAAVTIAIGLAIVLLVSGLVEGFVTPSGMPWAVKDAIGVILAVAFWLYIWVVGRAAAREGATGDVEGDFATADAPVAA